MAKNVLFAAIVSVFLAVSGFITTSPALAGNGSSQPKEEVSLPDIVTYYGDFMKKNRKVVCEEFGEGVKSVEMKMIERYEFKSTNTIATFLGDDEEATPMGMTYDHPDLKQVTVSDVKKLLGEPTIEATDVDGMLKLQYDPVEGSVYRQCHVAFKFESSKLRKIAFVAM